ncbi:MAG: PilN domain-containing protein [Pyrinomonadaceae bacterium]|nr:PilN domain-containing protein [Pyrinomonadaceae bacterium]
MSTKLNLAGKPFSNRALPWTVTILVVFVSLVAFVLIIRATARAKTQSQAVQSDINALNQQAQAFQKQAEEVRIALTAEQHKTLGSAHELVDRKRFSWSRLLADLESALPGNVRVTRISVRDVAARDDQTLAGLDLTVVSKAPSTITEMIANMDRAGIFQAELRSQNLQKGRGETGTEYELSVLYRPRAGSATSVNSAAALASAESTASPSEGRPR